MLGTKFVDQESDPEKPFSLVKMRRGDVVNVHPVSMLRQSLLYVRDERLVSNHEVSVLYPLLKCLFDIESNIGPCFR